MAPTEASTESLHRKILDLAGEADAEAVAVAYHDYATRTEWSVNGDEVFHAASTIKIAVLAALYAAVDQGMVTPMQRLHVRNRFISAVTDRPFRVSADRDGNSVVHARRGHTMRFRDLARHMIVTSSNLATNLLIDFLGVEFCRSVVEEMGADGVELRRGVEDDAAHEAGVDNTATAEGMRSLLRAIHEGRVHSPTSREAMLDILFDQEFASGIPAGLPDGTPVAHKTGEISTVAHDAGIVCPRGRRPYVLVVMTRWEAGRGDRRDTIARLSRMIWEHLPPDPGARDEDADE